MLYQPYFEGTVVALRLFEENYFKRAKQGRPKEGSIAQVGKQLSAMAA